MDVWTLNEKLKIKDSEIKLLEKRVAHIEGYLTKMNTKLALINKNEVPSIYKKKANETIQDKKSKPSRVRTKRSSTKKSKSS